MQGELNDKVSKVSGGGRRAPESDLKGHWTWLSLH